MKSVVTIIITIFILLTGSSCNSRKNIAHKQSYPIWVWAEESEIPSEAKLRSGEYKSPWHSHPCGVVRKIEVSKIPPYGAPDFIKGTERVIEFDDRGKIIGYWAMPVNSWVMAVENDSIIVRYNFNEKAMSISRNGDISLTDPVDPVSRLVKCPHNLESEFKNSSYDRCVEFTDTKTGKHRLLAYEMPCT